MTFSQLELAPVILNALPQKMSQPTDIQRLAIPVVLSGQDLVALAQTGSGKTFAYGLPLMHKVDVALAKPQVLIMVPTRELAVQISESLNDIANKLSIRVATLCGGAPQREQVRQLEDGAQIVVATPGRLLDLLNQHVFNLEHIAHWVLDEADRLLDMGFWPDIEKVAKLLEHNSCESAGNSARERPQRLLLSATLADKLNRLAMSLMDQPQRVQAHQANSTVESVNEQLYLVNKGSKAKALQWLLTEHQHTQALVFISGRDSVDAFAKKMSKAGVNVAALHGEKDHAQRLQTLKDFKAKKIQVLIATDLLARGIDVEQLPLVINLDLPASAPTYVHRVGRTARAGHSGLAISLVSHGEQQALDAIRALTNRALPLATLENFPVTDKPASATSKRPPRDKQANRRTAKKRKSGAFKPRS